VAIQRRASAFPTGANTAAASVTIPAVTIGDLMLLFWFTANDGTNVAPTGWTFVDKAVGTTTTNQSIWLYKRVAIAGDAGSTAGGGGAAGGNLGAATSQGMAIVAYFDNGGASVDVDASGDGNGTFTAPNVSISHTCIGVTAASVRNASTGTETWGTIPSGYTKIDNDFAAGGAGKAWCVAENLTTSTITENGGTFAPGGAGGTNAAAMTIGLFASGGVVNGSVAAVAATSTSAGVAPTVTGESIVSGGAAASSTATAVAPTVTAIRNANVTSVVATSTSAAAAPAVTGGAGVTAVAVSSTSTAPAPAVSGAASVTTVVATSSSAAIPPSVSTTGAGTVIAVVATSTSAAVPPTIQYGYTVTAVTATGAIAPTVSTTGAGTVTAVRATGSSAAIAPTVTTGSGGTVTERPRRDTRTSVLREGPRRRSRLRGRLVRVTAGCKPETISTSIWVVPTGIVQNSASSTTTTATIWLSGGTAGTTYELTNRIVTNQGRTNDHTIRVWVTNQ
jgi:hypothetical protein